jgi:hypothetical protein
MAHPKRDGQISYKTLKYLDIVCFAVSHCEEVLCHWQVLPKVAFGQANMRVLLISAKFSNVKIIFVGTLESEDLQSASPTR